MFIFNGLGALFGFFGVLVNFAVLGILGEPYIDFWLGAVILPAELGSEAAR